MPGPDTTVNTENTNNVAPAAERSPVTETPAQAAAPAPTPAQAAAPAPAATAPAVHASAEVKPAAKTPDAKTPDAKDAEKDCSAKSCFNQLKNRVHTFWEKHRPHKKDGKSHEISAPRAARR